jgi:hypothetical protein
VESKYAEENVSTKQPPPRQKARLSRSHGDEKRPRGDKTPTRERAQASDGSTLLRFSLSREARLLKRAEFLRVYEQGTRIAANVCCVRVLD